MKTIIKLALAAAAFIAPAGMQDLLAQESTSNYILTKTHISQDSTQYARRVVSYYDGLGRPVQTLRRAGAVNGDDLVDRTEYDSLGRAYRIWNPVAVGTNNGHQVSASSVASLAQDYYSDNSPFSETLYDGSPLDRVRKVTGPGQAWHAAGKGVKSGYLTNTSADSLKCRKFGFSLSGNTGITFSNDGSFSVGTLTVERTEDEDGRTLWVFKDMRGLTVLERRLAKAAVAATPATYADTYYLYDNAGRLVAVLPPELSKYFTTGSWSGSTESDPKVEGLAYQYRYDARGRMIAKKLPGAAWTYYVYDKGDRLVLTQDGNQRDRGEWSFRVQDALGRECLTGVLTGTCNAFNDPLGNVLVVAARDRNAETYGTLHGYLVSGLNLLQDREEVLTVNWWDDYSFLGREEDMPGSSYGYTAPPSGSSYGVQYAGGAQGLLTGHWSKSLGEVRSGVGAAVCETWAYDDHGRTVFHVKGYPSGKRVVERSGYDFVGNLTSLGKTLYDEGTTSHTEAYTYTYDNWGRQQNTTHSLDGSTAITLSSNSYDAVGRLSGTTRGGGVPGLASTYTYNVRNWLTGIGGTLFSETLTYETPRTGSSLPGQWGGNISGVQSTAGSGTQTMRYDFGYDLLGRLTTATYGGGNANSTLKHSRSYAYDLNGNMNHRRSNEADIMYNGSWLEWTWDMGDGNRPNAWHQQREFVPNYNPSGPAQVADAGYTYDGMGNRTAELDAQGDTLNVLRYNLLNLPEEYVSTSGETVKYVYSADGEKLYVQQTTSSNTTQGTEYAANYRIDDGMISMIHTDAGYYTPMLIPPGSAVPEYGHLWYLKDHLGNNRVLVSKQGAALASYNYDPFGQSIAITQTPPASFFPPTATESPYRYGGKEWNATSSTYDFEARYLSPSFHRFTTMDPLCEKYYHISPYAYCAGNPINFVDPDGMQWYLCTDEEGHSSYEYYEGEMPDEDKEKYSDVQYLGATYHDPNTDIYYSLFGRRLYWTGPSGGPGEGQLYDVIDRLIITRMTNMQDPESGENNKVYCYIDGAKEGQFRITYKGKTFTTGYNSWFWNNKDQRAFVDVTPSTITEENYFLYTMRYYALEAHNPPKGAGDQGFEVLRLVFDEPERNKFINSWNNIVNGLKSMKSK